jgi:dTDP-D-glucose 4,6-dehydratase
VEAFAGFEQGLERTVNWYLENQTWLNITGGNMYYEKQYLELIELIRISVMDATNKLLQ